MFSCRMFGNVSSLLDCRGEVTVGFAPELNNGSTGEFIGSKCQHRHANLANFCGLGKACRPVVCSLTIIETTVLIVMYGFKIPSGFMKFEFRFQIAQRD